MRTWGGVLVAVAAAGAFLAAPLSAQVFTQTPAPSAKPAPKPKPKPKPRSTQSTTQRKAATVATPPVPRSFSDPAAYCQANPTVDQPTSPYAGPAVPDWVAGAVVPAGKSKSMGATAWRCMGGRVLACHDATGQGLCTKPDQSTVATEELTRFCEGKRNAKVPDTVVPHSVPVWACRKGKPEITGYRAGIDAQGYFGESWRDVTGFAPANMLGAVPRGYVGQWISPVKGKGFIFTITYTVLIEMRGGALGANAATVSFYAPDMQGQPKLTCQTALTLRAATTGGLVFDERLQANPSGLVCPQQGHVTMRMEGDRLIAEWRKKADDKVRMVADAERVRK